MKLVTIQVRSRGPLVIEGEFEIITAEGERMELRGVKKLKLCRCGHTLNAPICDGSHYKTDFESL